MVYLDKEIFPSRRLGQIFTFFLIIRHRHASVPKYVWENVRNYC